MADFTYETISHGQNGFDLLATHPTMLTMGPRAAQAVGIKQSILQSRGYVWPIGTSRCVPTVGPGHIQRGNAKYSAAFINDLQKAVELSRNGMPAEFQAYLLDPSPLAALRWAEEYVEWLKQEPDTYLAFDIETPGKPEAEDESDTDGDAPDRTWNIERIGFSYRPLKALSIPWEPAYFAAIRLVLGTAGNKVVWNAGFDVPRIRRAGVTINGVIHDGMVAWHILHSDLPKRLGFVATFTCPWQPAWKHLSGARPAFYNATDADVELRSMLVIERELKQNGLWEVYQRDVLDLEPILVHMHMAGMPVDADIRLDRAIRLAVRQEEVRKEMEFAVPLEARRIAIVYKSTPKDCAGLLNRPTQREVSVCPRCGLERPPRSHFKVFKKKLNDCGGLEPTPSLKDTQEYYRLSEFTPSRDQLIRYHQHLKRALPMVFDKKTMKRRVSFGERQLKDLTSKWPNDTLYKSIIDYRELDKLAGTYIGRPIEQGGTVRE